MKLCGLTDINFTSVIAVITGGSRGEICFEDVYNQSFAIPDYLHDCKIYVGYLEDQDIHKFYFDRVVTVGILEMREIHEQITFSLRDSYRVLWHDASVFTPQLLQDAVVSKDKVTDTLMLAK